MNEAIVKAIKCGKEKKKKKILITHYVRKNAVSESQRPLWWAYTAGL